MNAWKQLIFRVHAIQRMALRGIDVADVEHVLATGEQIESYPDDTPLPSQLMLGFRDSRPIHVVMARNEDNAIVVITVYQPDLKHWNSDFKSKRRGTP